MKTKTVLKADYFSTSSYLESDATQSRRWRRPGARTARPHVRMSGRGGWGQRVQSRQARTEASTGTRVVVCRGGVHAFGERLVGEDVFLFFLRTLTSLDV